MSTTDAARGVDPSPVGGDGGPRSLDQSQPPLRITVYHGDLQYVGLPVIVGSFDGTPLGGAEHAVDAFLDGSVRRRAALRRRHGAAGTCELFTARGGTEPAALLVGLGNPGDLTPGALADLVTDAVLRFAADRLDQLTVDGADPEGRVRKQLAAVLIGTTGQAPLTVANALAALVTGTRRANRVLTDRANRVRADRSKNVLTDPEPQLTIDELFVVELYEERAIEAHHAATRLCAELGGDAAGLTVGPHVRKGTEGRTGLPRTIERDAWRSIRIVGSRPPRRGRIHPLVELSFTSVGRSARAEQQVTSAQRALVERLVDETIRRPDVSDQLCNTLYELLVPNAMKGQVRGSENLMCVVDEYAAGLPLEMLAIRTIDNEIIPIGTRAGLVRRLETRNYREGVRAATGTRALVIADPLDTGRPQLDGARMEAHRVVEALKSKKYEVTWIISKNSSSGDAGISGILNALFACEYRIVHIAGHGVFDPRSPAGTGVLIGDGEVLSAVEVAKMAAVPDLFFLNCCHLGAMGEAAADPVTPRPDRLAATIARQLVDNGVRAVVAAGWAVNDEAAGAFAERFYTELFDGRDLGTASTEARKHVRQKYRAYNTWGAFQVYGPPSFLLDAVPDRSYSFTNLVAPGELRDALDWIARRADNAYRDAVPELASKLVTLIEGMPSSWVDDELERIGTIWTALGEYEKALAAFEQARQAWTGRASLRSLEQLVNMKVKYACLLLGADPPEQDKAEKLLTEAEESLHGLLKVSDTPERRSIYGSLERRKAQFPALGPVREALERSRAEYQAAETLYLRRDGTVDYYSGLNRVVVSWLLSFHGAPAPDTAEVLATVSGYAQAVAGRPPTDFWSRVNPADCAFTEALLQDALTDPETRDRVARGYETVFAGRSTRRERLTVVEHLEVLERCLPADGDDRAAATRGALADLRTRLEAHV